MTAYPIIALDGSEPIRMVRGELVPVTFRCLDAHTPGEPEPVRWRELENSDVEAHTA